MRNQYQNTIYACFVAYTFAEKGLGVSKAVGDLAGPMAFAALMGTSRAVYGKFGGAPVYPQIITRRP